MKTIQYLFIKKFPTDLKIKHKEKNGHCCVTSDTWHGTHVMWHMTHREWWTLSQDVRSLALTVLEKWCPVTHDILHMTCDMWHVTCDMWHMTCDTWHMTSKTQRVVNIVSIFQVSSSKSFEVMVSCDTWNMSCDMLHVTHEVWHVTRNIWYVTPDTQGMVKIVSKLMVPGSNSLRVMVSAKQWYGEIRLN